MGGELATKKAQKHTKKTADFSFRDFCAFSGTFVAHFLPGFPARSPRLSRPPCTPGIAPRPAAALARGAVALQDRGERVHAAADAGEDRAPLLRALAGALPDFAALAAAPESQGAEALGGPRLLLPRAQPPPARPGARRRSRPRPARRRPGANCPASAPTPPRPSRASASARPPPSWTAMSSASSPASRRRPGIQATAPTAVKPSPRWPTRSPPGRIPASTIRP
jgi:hypothetical protein